MAEDGAGDGAGDGAADGAPGGRPDPEDATTHDVADRAAAGPGRSFAHDASIWSAHPGLRALGATFELTAADGSPARPVALHEAAAAHLAVVAGDAARPVESALEPIRAWRAVFTSMGVRPTQYRCAAESLLRRLRTHGDLPVLHPVVDLCNALSVRWAVPVAVIDLDHVHGDLTVRQATGTEDHTTFAGDLEHPDPGEVAYVDDAGHAHSRRWCWRQSAASVITPATRRVLVVAEAVHDHAETNLLDLGAALADALSTAGVTCAPTLLTADRPQLLLPTQAPGHTEALEGAP